MPHGLADWELIKAAWEEGASSNSLAKKHPVTRQVIDARAKRDGWERKPVMLVPMLKDLPCVKRGFATARDPARLAAVLHEISGGVSKAQACAMAGVSEATLDRMRDEDEGLDALYQQARAVYLAKQQKRVDKAGETDWKAAKWILETAPETRGEYVSQAGPTTAIQINIER